VDQDRPYTKDIVEGAKLLKAYEQE
jgi:hypothetical protein